MAAKQTASKCQGTTPLASDCKGKILSGEADQLHATAKEAVTAGDFTKAAHFYTMAIDQVAKSLKKDSNGRASDADLLALNRSSEARLSELLSGRSHVYLRKGDIHAAVEDAETCTRADPSYEKGFLRLAVAYEAAGVDLSRQLAACERGLEGCPSSQVLVTRKWRLKKALAECKTAPGQGHAADTAVDEEWGIEQTRQLADNTSDPRHFMAAADFGRAAAAGAHGLERDLKVAARYLTIAAEGGDTSAQRDLGLVLLDLEQPVEASEQLKKAAEAGDEESAAILKQLLSEVEERQKEARAQLEKMAEMGDPRALRMLAEFGV